MGVREKHQKTVFSRRRLDARNAASAVKALYPFAVDVSSGIETDGVKDKTKMAAFIAAVRKEAGL